jgi:ribosomal protein S18 acetylase RimI-like enzyme
MTPAELERAAARHWRATEEEYLGDWLLRAAEGFTGRANSALALGDPGRPLADALDEVVAWYRARKLPAMIQLPADHELDFQLSKRRWAIRPGPAVVMTADVAEAPVPAEVRFDDEPDEVWLARYNYRGIALPPVAKTVLLSAREQSFVSIRQYGEAIAIARLSLDGDLAGLTAIEVHPDHRRQGLGSAITLAACAEAGRRGASHVFLQVATENTAARALYERTGFRVSHEYHYRVAPASPGRRGGPTRGGRCF